MTSNKCILYISKYADLNLFFKYYLNCIFYHSEQNKISVSHITTLFLDEKLQLLNEELKKIGFSYIKNSDVNYNEYDYIISVYGLDSTFMMGGGGENIIKCAQYAYMELQAQQVEESKIIPCTFLCDSKFSIENFHYLNNNPSSILVNQCFGRYTYLNLGQKFYSPFVNITLSGKDLLKIASSPQYYLSAKITHLKNVKLDNRMVPVILLGDDVEIRLDHYTDVIHFEKLWRKRASRFNFKNMVLVLQAYDNDDVDEFKTLNFNKKLCFVEDFRNDVIFEADTVNNIISVNYGNYLRFVNKNNHDYEHSEHDFNMIVNSFGLRNYNIYSLIAFLVTGKIECENINIENRLAEYFKMLNPHSRVIM